MADSGLMGCYGQDCQVVISKKGQINPEKSQIVGLPKKAYSYQYRIFQKLPE